MTNNMKKSNNIISDWLDKYGDPEIEIQVKKEIEHINNKIMKEFKGTKGQWRIQEQFDTPNLITDSEDNKEWNYALSSYIFGNDRIIGETRYQTDTGNGYDSVNILSEMRANSKLIAAAPELLDALQILFKSTYPNYKTVDDSTHPANLALKAINKALN